MQDGRIKILLEKYRAGTCSESEKQELASLILSDRHDEMINEFLQQAWDDAPFESDMPHENAEKIITSILGGHQEVGNDNQTHFAPVKRINTWQRWAAAASVILILLAGSYFIFNGKQSNTPGQVAKKPASEVMDVPAPESNKAAITLANGQTVYLSDIQNGLLASEADADLVKYDNGQLAYQSKSASNNKAPALVYNTLTNPKGSNVVDITLADGSRVWLNAGSSITYPVIFSGNDRRVTISGEGYFEVAHNANKPFYVKARGVEVRVLGTHFNINCYSDESAIKTTLLEGSVKVSNGVESKIISPGEQALVVDGQEAIKVSGANGAEATAWKDGVFWFTGADMREVMRQVGRWYDVNVELDENIGAVHISGKAGRDLSLRQMMKVLEESGIDVQLNGKEIIARAKSQN